MRLRSAAQAEPGSRSSQPALEKGLYLVQDGWLPAMEVGHLCSSLLVRAACDGLSRSARTAARAHNSLQ